MHRVTKSEIPMLRRSGLLALLMIWTGLTSAGAQDGDSLGDAVSPPFVRVPLGGSITAGPDEGPFAVYVPTRFGGVLTIEASQGQVTQLTGPDRVSQANGRDVGQGRHGWYTFRIEGAESRYTVSSRFVQTARSRRRPWNFYYWPTKADVINEPWAGGNGRVDTRQLRGDDRLVSAPGGYIEPGRDVITAGPNGLLETPVQSGDESTWFPNLYDDLTYRGADGAMYQTPAPMLKYDQIYGTSARQWEAANSQTLDIQRWPGHCLGGAVASLLLNEPMPAPGSGLTADELKGLYAELGENHFNQQIGDKYITHIAAGPPRPGPDACDRSAAPFHAILEHYLAGRKKALLGNLRAFPPRGTPNEVWNHGVFQYIATYHAVPGGPETAVRLEVELFANSGNSLNGEDTEPRKISYEYTLAYRLDGAIDEVNVWGNDWIRVRGDAMYAPLNLMDVVSTRWNGHNPMISESNVRSLDVANGGSRARFGSTPRRFVPVASYEAGRAPMFTSNNGGGGGFFDGGLFDGGLFGRGGRLFGGNPTTVSAPTGPRNGLIRLFGGR